MKSVKFRNFFPLVFFTLFLTLISSAWAAGSDWNAGILGGIAVSGATVSSGTSPNLDSSSAQVSYKIGVQGEHVFVPSLVGVEADVLYSQYSWLLNIIGGPQSVSYSADFWEIPLFINYLGLPDFKFGLGPFFDFASGSLAQYGWGSFNAGVGVQTGYEHSLGSGLVLNVDLRYMMGLTNLYDNASTNDLKIHSFDVLAGLEYRL